MLFVLLFALAIFYLVGIIIYRLKFHPLAEYPGPFLARITDWYHIYHCFLGDSHLRMYRSHQEYGSFVRYGPNKLSINSNTALKAIYDTKANVQKSSFYSTWPIFFGAWSTQTMIDVYKYRHTEKRRALAQNMTDHALQSMHDVLLPYIRTFCELLIDSETSRTVATDDGWSSARNVIHLTSQLSHDLMGEICFGQSFEMMKRSENHYLIDLIRDGARLLFAAGQMPGVLETGLHHLLFPSLLRNLERFISYAKLQSERQSQIGGSSNHFNVFAAMRQARDPKTGSHIFNPTDLNSEASLLIIAGSETTATAMAAVLFYLLHNPQTLGKAQYEIRNAFPDIDDIRSGARLSGCQYLRACIDEAMRMSPPIPGLMPREVLSGGIEIDGHLIPAGAVIGTSHYALQHEPAYFPNPYLFRPERWLIEGKSELTKRSSAEKVRLARSAFCPFSIGPRGCVGKQMAYYEMMTVIGRVLWDFEMRLVPGSSLGKGSQGAGLGRERDEYQLLDFFTAETHGPLVNFKLRRSA